MTSIDTQRGTLLIPENRDDLWLMDYATCLDWVRRNDPNGQWSDEDLEDYATTVDDLREAVWYMTEDYR